MARQDKPKEEIRNKTSWSEANDARGKVHVVDPEQGPSGRQKK